MACINFEKDKDFNIEKDKYFNIEKNKDFNIEKDKDFNIEKDKDLCKTTQCFFIGYAIWVQTLPLVVLVL